MRHKQVTAPFTGQRLERLHVGAYTITKQDNGDYWIELESGEGMSTSSEVFADLIHTFYVQEF